MLDVCVFLRGDTLVGSLVVAVKGGASFRCGFVDEVGFLDEVHVLNALAEIALVHFVAENGLIDVLKLCERKEVGQQVDAERLMAQLTMLLWSE